MIPLYKLEKLPRAQKLRKIVKIFSFAENRLNSASEKNAGIYTQAELIFFADSAKLLASDEFFPANARNVFKEAYNFFSMIINGQPWDYPVFLRTLNNIKHILYNETGREQADWDFTCGGGLDADKRQIIEGMHVYLEDIRSPFNVGAMFRTAESFGVEKIILSPFCADPLHPRARRTAMGCADIIPWEKRELFPAQSENAAHNVPVFALETGGVPLAEFPFPRKGVMIAGSEELGVSPRALAAADASLGRVSIPCYGTKASLNVSVAFGIALQMWRSKILAAAV